MSRRNQAKKGKTRLARLRKKSRHLLVQNLRSLTGQEFTLRKSTDAIKMSSVLGEFIEPYMDYVETIKSYRTLLTTAMVAWNLSLMPEAIRPARLEGVLEALPPEGRADGKEIVLGMIERKQRYFSQYRRMILSYHAEETPDGWHLSVVSTPEPV